MTPASLMLTKYKAGGIYHLSKIVAPGDPFAVDAKHIANICYGISIALVISIISLYVKILLNLRQFNRKKKR